MRILFMGTPEFAVPSLQRMYDDGHEICGVFTQPDKPQGRKMSVVPPAVKCKAKELNVDTYQPERLKNDEVTDLVKKLKPQLIVVVAYGKLLPKELLSAAEYGPINVHGSLLPKYRGAGPIQWAIISGEEKTGITTMYMEEELDAGDIIQQKETLIGRYETAGQLHERLSLMGAELLSETVFLIEKGRAARKPQNHERATFAPMLKKEDGLIPWQKSPAEIISLICGTNPWPVAYSFFSGNVMKIYSAIFTDVPCDLPPGSVFGDVKEGFFVCCRGGAVELRDIQLAGGKRMNAKDYLKGHPLKPGCGFDSHPDT